MPGILLKHNTPWNANDNLPEVLTLPKRKEKEQLMENLPNWHRREQIEDSELVTKDIQCVQGTKSPNNSDESALKSEAKIFGCELGKHPLAVDDMVSELMASQAIRSADLSSHGIPFNDCDRFSITVKRRLTFNETSDAAIVPDVDELSKYQIDDDANLELARGNLIFPFLFS